MPSDDSSGGTAGARPILGTPDEHPERPRSRGRLFAYLIIGLVVAIAVGGWGYVMLTAGGNPQVNAQVISFDANASNEAQITFTVHKPADRAATCRLRALDVHHVEVGSRAIDVPPGKSDVALTERLRTTAQAATVHVEYCDLV